MPFLTIAFPVFDPIAIAIGPIAIRWYALAYIGGIVLGWLYARALIKNEKLWGGPAPITLPQMDDFILWVTVGIILGGRTGYVLFYNLPFFIQHPAEIFELWKGGMSFHGGFLGCVAAVMLFARKNGIPILSLGDITTAVAPIGLLLGRLANFINSELWGRPADSSVPWAVVFPNGGPLPRHPSQLYEAGLEGIVLFIDPGGDDPDGRAEAAGPDPRQFHCDLRICPHRRRILPRTRSAARIFVGRADHGYAVVGADDHCRSDPDCGGMAPDAAEPDSANQGTIVTEYSPLQSEIKKLIKSSGPMPVWRYMELCLTHPQHGYYVSRDPLGREGDFTTAPEVSQMFGELLGLWAASVWKAIGSPPLLRLIELGPGRGTMMADALRALRVLPPLYQSLSIHLVEINPVLRDKQKATLSGVRNIAWHDNIDEVPEGPAVIFANEYFDVLPIHQVVKREAGWHERTVEIDDDGKLAFGAAPEPMPRFEVLLPPLVRAAPVGAVFEWRPDAEIMKIATRVRDQDGAALIIDYGHLRSDAGDTFQAIARHSFTDPLKNPGQADVTAHVDFQALARAAEDVGARVHGPVSQGDFLKRLGIETRAVTPDGESHQRGFRGHLGRAETAGRRRPRRHGVDVQGARGLRTPPHRRGRVQRRQGREAGRRGGAVMTLESPLLSAIPGLRHAFFTREGGVSGGIYGSLNAGVGSNDDPADVEENRRRMAEQLGVSPAHFLTLWQTHSPDVVVTSAPWQGGVAAARRRHRHPHRGSRHRRHRGRLRTDPVCRPRRARDRRGACGMEGRADRHRWNPPSTPWKNSAPNATASSPPSAP